MKIQLSIVFAAVSSCETVTVEKKKLKAYRGASRERATFDVARVSRFLLLLRCRILLIFSL